MNWLKYLFINILCLLCFAVVDVSAQRQVENLERGLVAVRSGNGNFLSWRLLGKEYQTDIGFNIYRNDTKITQSPITTKTNYYDNGAAANAQYYVRAVVSGVEQAASKTVTVWAQQYLRIPLQRPAGGTTPDNVAYTYSPNDASVGDLTGDGEYEIVLKWDPSNSKDNSQSGYTGNVYLDGYTLEGQFLWRIDLGRNIRAGAHYTQFMVYDFDGDGIAEIVCKTAPGTRGGDGQFLKTGPAATANHNADYRNSSGYILSGPEYLTVFNGRTGVEMATIEYIPLRGTVSSWGDSYGNRVDRFLAGVAYLDGKKPSMIFSRGYYTRTVIAAFDWDGTSLSHRWTFDSGTNSSSPYYGQGNHSLTIGDIDGDGNDEIIFGSMAINNDGTPIYSTRFGHGDAGHLSNMDPTRSGMEYFQPYESANGSTIPGVALIDAATGTVLWRKEATGDIGRGICMDIDPNHLGYECWASGGLGVYDIKGQQIYTTYPTSTGGSTSINMGIWWTGDLLREILDKAVINKFNYTNRTTDRIYTIYNAAGTNSVGDINGTKSNPNLVADLFGDWREEVIFRATTNDALYVFTTTYETNHMLYTLMHDPQYRVAIAWQNVAYNQPPHPSFYLGEGMSAPPQPHIVYVGEHSDAQAVDACVPVGWATQNGGVTGGGNASPVVVTNYSQLHAALTNPAVPVVHVSGTIDVSGQRIRVQDQSNKSIIGLPGARLISNDITQSNSGILYVQRVQNLIIRNLIFEGPGAYDVDGYDLLCLDDCQNVWVDHCEFYDGVDGNFDIKTRSDFISITWCKFAYNKPAIPGGPGGSNDHRFSNLIGSSDNATDDRGKLNITFQFCHWGEGCRERMPRIRFGNVHMVNNLFNSSVSNHNIRAAFEANVLVEGNYFDNQTRPIQLFDATAIVTERNNHYVNCSGASRGTAFTPPYSLSILPAEQVKDVVLACVGATLININGCSPCAGAAPPVFDCNGVENGTAYLDDCERCVAGNTGRFPCVTDIAEGYYTIRPLHSDLCLSHVQDFTQQTCINDGSQVWEIQKSGNYYRLFSPAIQEYVSYEHAENAANVGFGVGSHRDFIFEAFTDGSIMMIPLENQSKAADVFNISYVPGGFISFWDRNQGEWQRFSFTPTTASFDCNNTWAGTAEVDNCGVCAGGATGISPCTLIEAEDACEFDGTIDANHAGFSGTGFLNVSNAVGSDFTIYMYAQEDAMETVYVKYANGAITNRPCRILLNGVEVYASFDFNPTGAWAHWVLLEMNIPFSAGLNILHVVSLTSDGGPNFDAFGVSENISFAPCVSQTIEFAEGWNLISVSVLGLSDAINTVFSGLDVEIVKNADGFWNPNQPEQFNSLHTIEPGKGYLVYMNVAGTIQITGIPSVQTPNLGVSKGWQLIGYPCSGESSFAPMPISNYFNATNAEIIKNFDGFWMPNGTAHSLHQFEVGKGYFLKQ